LFLNGCWLFQVVIKLFWVVVGAIQGGYYVVWVVVGFSGWLLGCFKRLLAVLGDCFGWLLAVLGVC